MVIYLNIKTSLANAILTWILLASLATETFRCSVNIRDLNWDFLTFLSKYGHHFLLSKVWLHGSTWGRSVAPLFVFKPRLVFCFCFFCVLRIICFLTFPSLLGPVYSLRLLNSILSNCLCPFCLRECCRVPRNIILLRSF